MQKMILQKLFSQVQDGGLDVQYWDGTLEQYGDAEPNAKLIINDSSVVGQVFTEPERVFGESYMDGRVEVEGDLQEVVRLAIANQDILDDKGKRESLALRALKAIPGRLSRGHQKKEVQYHYDIGNDFYALWLDETLSYSCAYFRSPDDTLHQAQLNKVDHILRKLQLKPGQTLLDIGSGWGRLIIQAARQYGVKAMGVTLSEEQTEYTERRIAEEGLQDQVEVGLMDYRTLAEQGRTFDRVVSVGMFEHVGRENIPKYMEAVKKMLKPGGVSMLHTITHMEEAPVNTWITNYIFPGGYIPSLRETIWQLPDHGFHLVDLESLRLHYARTLEHWAQNYEAVVDRVKDQFGERFTRMWRLYLNSCAASFRYSGLDVHQILFTRGLNNSLAMTRDHIYA